MNRGTKEMFFPFFPNSVQNNNYVQLFKKKKCYKLLKCKYGV